MNETLIGLYHKYKKIDEIVTQKEIYALTVEVEGYEGPLIKVLESDGSTELDIYALPNGKLDIAALEDHCGSEDGYITVWYGQKEFADLTPPTQNNYPKIANEGTIITFNGEPAIQFDGTDDYIQGTIPYSASQAEITLTALFARQDNPNNDIVIGTDATSNGVIINGNGTSRYLTSNSYRTSNSNVTNSEIMDWDTMYACSVVSLRDESKLYQNGVLRDTAIADDTDLTLTATKLQVGTWAGASGHALKGYVQCISVSLTDDSDYIEQIHNELLTRYNSELLNPRKYYGDKPEILPNGEKCEGRLTGDIKYSEHAKIFAWASRPSGGYGAVTLQNNDSFINDLVTDPYDFIEIFKIINDSTRLMNYQITSGGGGDIDEYLIEDNGCTIMLWGDGNKSINIPTYKTTTKTRLKFDYKNTGDEPKEVSIGIDTTNPASGLEGRWQIFGDTIGSGNQDYNNYSGSDWITYIIDCSTESIGDLINYIFFINDQDSGDENESRFRNIYLYEEGQNIIDYYYGFGAGQLKNTGFIDKGQIRLNIRNPLETLNKSINPYYFNASTYTELENIKRPLVVGKCYLTEPLISISSTLEYFCHKDKKEVIEVYDNGVALTGGGVGFTETNDGFTLVANPVGKIKADVKGEVEGASYKETIDEIIPYLLENINIYDYSLSDLEEIENSIKLHWTGQEGNAKQVINQLIESLIGYVYPDSFGFLRFGVLVAPTTNDNTLKEIEINGEPLVFKDLAENLSNLVAGEKNWTPYAQGEIAFAATAADKITFVKDYRTVKSVGLTKLSERQKSNESFKTLISDSTDVQTIADDIETLFSVDRYFYTIKTSRVFRIGQDVNVTHALKGLENGKDLKVISRELKVKGTETTYTFWG